MEKTEYSQAAAQRRYKKNLHKKIRFWIELQLGDQVYLDRLPRRARHPESGTIDPLSGHSNSLGKAITEESRKLLPRTTGPYTVRSATQSTVTIYKSRAGVPVSPDLVTEVLRVANNKRHKPRLNKTASQPETCTRKNIN